MKRMCECQAHMFQYDSSFSSTHALTGPQPDIPNQVKPKISPSQHTTIDLAARLQDVYTKSIFCETNLAYYPCSVRFTMYAPFNMSGMGAAVLVQVQN
jgi:hypothetical protein